MPTDFISGERRSVNRGDLAEMVYGNVFPLDNAFRMSPGILTSISLMPSEGTRKSSEITSSLL
jgi:hypothetical protein